MSSKRKYQESMNEEIVHPSRQSQVPGSKPTPSKKPRQTEAPVYKRQVHASSVNAIKKRIREKPTEHSMMTDKNNCQKTHKVKRTPQKGWS